MATIVNTTPSTTDGEGSGTNFMIGAFLLIAFVVLLLLAVPALTRGIRNSAPAQSTPVVPEQIDVNLNAPNGQPAQQ